MTADEATLARCTPSHSSGLALFFDADLLGLGTFDRTTSGKALIAKNTQGLDFRALATTFAVLEYFEVARAGHAVFINGFFPLRHGAPEYQQFANMLNWRGVEFVSQRLKHGFAGSTVIRENADFDQSMGVQGSVDFFFDGGGKAIATHHDDGVKVVGFGAVFFALGRGQLNLGHAGIIGHEGKNENTN